MMTTTLERVTTVPDSLLSLDEELAIAAEKELGYSAGNRANDQITTERALYTELLDHGFRPFTVASVERYKRRVVCAKWVQMVRWQLLAPVSLLIGAYFIGHDYNFLPVPFLFGAIAAAMVPVFAVQPANWSWIRSTLENYHQPVPAHILQTALMIRRAMPDVHLIVEDFSVRRRAIADPFLIVARGGAEAYVEVWDEPTFQST